MISVPLLAYVVWCGVWCGGGGGGVVYGQAGRLTLTELSTFLKLKDIKETDASMPSELTGTEAGV